VRFDKLVEFADRHPEGWKRLSGAAVLNRIGLPGSPRRLVSHSLGPLLGYPQLAFSRIFLLFVYEEYLGGRGDRASRRLAIRLLVMFSADLLKNLGGFDEQVLLSLSRK